MTKVTRRYVPHVACIFLGLVLLMISCAPRHRLVPPAFGPEGPPDAMDRVLKEVWKLWEAKDYEGAASLLRAAGQREYSYYRTDELLYWLGRCNLALDEPQRAERCFRLLRQYYPRSDSKFPNLARHELEVRNKLAALPERAREAERLSAAEREGNREYAGPLVSNIYYETDIRQALTDLSAQTGISIVPDAMVQGYVTVEFTDIPLEQALQQLLSPLGLSYRKMNGFYLVGAPLADSPSFAMLVETEQIHPQYLRAADIPKLLPDYYRGFMQVDEGANTITISAPPDIASRFKEELAAIDHPPQQIMIEALVVEMGSEARRSLGLDWDWTGTKENATFRIAKLVPALMDSSFVGELFKEGEEYHGAVLDLRQALRALAYRDKAHIRANPRVTTQDGHKATIRIGRESYHSLVRGSVNYPYITLEKIATGITLTITPYVGNSAEITTDITMEVSDVTGAGADNLPVTSVRSVDTRIRVANGQTVGIGGLVAETTREARNRIPFLGDLPLLGYLFGTTTTEKIETEVVVLITPHLLISPEEFDNL